MEMKIEDLAAAHLQTVQTRLQELHAEMERLNAILEQGTNLLNRKDEATGE